MINISERSSRVFDKQIEEDKEQDNKANKMIKKSIKSSASSDIQINYEDTNLKKINERR